MISKRKGNSTTFNPNQKGNVFQELKGLQKAVMNFKYFQAFIGPVRTL